MTASTRYERNLPGILDDLSADPPLSISMTSLHGPAGCGSGPAGRSPKGGSPWLTSHARGRSRPLLHGG